MLNTAAAQGISINQTKFNQIERLAEKLKEMYPPEEYFVVGIGRSPTPILAYFAATTPGYAAQMPLSNFRLYRPVAKKIGIFPARKINPKNEKLLFEHFDNFIPSPAELGGRRLVTVDFTNNGDTLLCAYEYIAKYLAQNNRPRQKTVAIVTDRMPEHLERGFKHEGVQDLSLFVIKENSTIAKQFEKEEYKDFAEYGRYFVGQETARVLNPRYQELVEAISEHIVPYAGAKSCSVIFSL